MTTFPKRTKTETMDENKKYQKHMARLEGKSAEKKLSRMIILLTFKTQRVLQDLGMLEAGTTFHQN